MWTINTKHGLRNKQSTFARLGRNTMLALGFVEEFVSSVQRRAALFDPYQVRTRSAAVGVGCCCCVENESTRSVERVEGQHEFEVSESVGLL